MTGGEVRGLVRHAVHRIQNVSHGVVARAADRIAGSAQLEGLGFVQGADGDRRSAILPQPLVGRCTEKRDRGDVVCDLRRHRLWYRGSWYARWYGGRGGVGGPR